MTLAGVEARCRALPGAVASHPFGPHVLVFKAGPARARRMFALLGHLADHPVVSLKCDPERSLVLRTSFAAIQPGYHLHKLHWNTITLDGTVPAPLLRELIDHAHALVTAKASRK